jgi:hypothetical protein
MAAALAGVTGLVALGHFQRQPAMEERPYLLREGDILFHGNSGRQNDAIRAATGSRFTHCGMVIAKDGRLMVLEAVQPVRITTVEAFRARSLPGTFHARRLANPMDPVALAAAKSWGLKQVGRNYDLRFQWADGALYCSELVWKIHARGGVELCTPKRFHDYQLDHPAVQDIIARRYGSTAKLPRDEPVVAPGDLAHSPLLVEVPRAETEP